MTIYKLYTIADASFDDKEIIFHRLNGFGSDYMEISTMIRTRDNPISFKELYVKLVDYEAYLKREMLLLSSPILLRKLILAIKARSITNKSTVYIIILEAKYNNVTIKVSTNMINNLTIKSHVKYVTCKIMLLRNIIACKLLFYGCYNLRTCLILHIPLYHLFDFYYQYYIFVAQPF